MIVYLLLAEGFEEIEAITIIDVLRRAEISVKIVSIVSHKKVIGSHGIAVFSDCTHREIKFNQSAAFILPGGMLGVDNLSKSHFVSDLLIKANQKKCIIGAICAAPIILGRLGLLNKRKATCFPGFESELLGATLMQQTTVIDENIITSVGVMSALEFAFTLISEIKHVDTALKIRNEIFFK